MVTEIDEGTRVLVLDPMECTVADSLATGPFFFLLITIALALATPA